MLALILLLLRSCSAVIDILSKVALIGVAPLRTRLLLLMPARWEPPPLIKDPAQLNIGFVCRCKGVQSRSKGKRCEPSEICKF